jgi:DNA-binding transcriptional LysR family regulator
MINFSYAQLRRLDLTLLLVFAEAMRTRKLGAVADRLGLTPSGVSHALTRLRDIFQDPLFLRHAAGVRPTPRAIAMLDDVNAAIAALSRTVEQSAFDSASIRRVFRIAAMDFGVTMLAPHLIEVIARDAPGVQLSFIALHKAEALRSLADGQIDIAIAVFHEAPPGFKRRVLAKESFVTVARKKHPKLRGGLTLRKFVELDHLLVSPLGDLDGPVDDALRRVGKTRRVVAALPQFLAALATAAASDVLVTVPKGLAKAYAPTFGLSVYETPIAMPGYEMAAVQGPLSARDPAVEWLVNNLLPAGRREWGTAT